MPHIGQFHPQVVHFVVVGGVLGLPLYWLAFVRKFRALRLTGTILLIVAASASWVAVESGSQAHELAERIPGVGAAVRKHEELGEDTRDLFTGVLLLELVALGLAWKAGGPDRPLMDVEVGEVGAARASTMQFAATAMRVVVGITWAFAALVLFEAAERGGDLVFDYAGGVGMRSGDPSDVEHLLIAGLYNQSLVERQNGNHEDAARLVREMLRQEPDDPSVRLLWVESLIQDEKDGRAALEALDSIAAQDPRTEVRVALSASSAYQLLGMTDSARAALQSVPERWRQSRVVQERLKELGGS